MKAIESYEPFNKVYRYKPNYILYEDFRENDNNFKMDISFNENGNVWIGFWNPGRQNKDGNEALMRKVKQISFIDKLEANEDNSWFTKTFTVEAYNSMKNIDKEVIVFTKMLMDSLNKNIQINHI